MIEGREPRVGIARSNKELQWDGERVRTHPDVVFSGPRAGSCIAALAAHEATQAIKKPCGIFSNNVNDYSRVV